MNKEKLISEFVGKMREVYVDRDNYSRGRIIDLAKNAFIEVISENCNLDVVSNRRGLLIAYNEFLEKPENNLREMEDSYYVDKFIGNL